MVLSDEPPVAGPSATPLASYRTVLRQKGFALVWLGQTVSEIGNGVYQVALGWTVYAVTGSTADMGIVLATNAIPQILLFLLGGVLGDRLPRRTVILAADLAAGAITALLALLAGGHGPTLAVLLTASALMGVTGAMYEPAFGAIVPDVLRSDMVPAGNALLGSSGSLARVCGPLLAGVMYALGGASAAFGADAASFAFSAACMAFVAAPRARAVYEGNVRSDLAEGIAFVARTRWLQLVMAVGLVANVLCVAPLLVLLPAIVRQAHGGPADLGLAIATQMVAATVCALLIPKMGRIGRSGTGLAALAGALAVGEVVVGVSRWLPLLLTGMALVGVGFGFNVIESTLVQSLVPRQLLSRVYSLMLAASFALLPVGYAAFGVLAQAIGLAAVLSLGGLCLAGVAGCAALSPSLRGARVGGATEE